MASPAFGVAAVTRLATSRPHGQARRWLRLETQRQQTEAHFRGLDLSMVEIGYRYRELWIALRSQEWELALYHTEKIELSLRLALERRPKRRASAQAFLKGSLPALQEMIKKRDPTSLSAGIEGFHHACLQCHQREKVPHFNPVVVRLRHEALTFRFPR